MRAAVIGLGEAGRIYARELASAGFKTRGYDVRHVSDAPADVEVVDHIADAVTDASLVLSLTTAAGSVDAARLARAHLAPRAVYADLNAASPSTKVAVSAELDDVLFADVAVLAPVARSGLATPALASGPGARAFADLMRPFGGDIEVLDAPPGAAASRKLLRSIFMKSLAASVLEALTAGRVAGAEDWVRSQIVAELDSGGAKLVERLVDGTYQHARRRIHEMEDTRDYLAELGSPSEMTSSTITWLSAIAAGER